MATTYFDDNNIALTVALMSDVHISSDKDTDRCAINYKNAIDLAKKYSKVGKLDALYHVGDLTQNVTYAEREGHENDTREIAFFKTLTDRYLDPETAFIYCTGNHDGSNKCQYEREFTDIFTSTQADIDRHYKYDIDRTAITDKTGNRHVVLGGYHFVSVGMFNDYVAYMKPILDKLTKEEPLKPVFAAFHFPAEGTVYSTHYEHWPKMNELKSFLDNYPQVIFLSGHSHCSLANPRAIWQGEFTAIDTSSVRFLDDNSLINFTVKIPVNATHNEVFAYASEAILLEADTSGNVRFTCYNTYRGDIIAVYTVHAPKADKSHLCDYTDRRKDKCPAPKFAENTAFSVTKTSDGCADISFDQAIAETSLWYYTVKFESEKESKLFYFTTRYHDLNGMPDKLFGSIEGLTPNEKYKVTLTPYNVWDVPGKALVSDNYIG